jgi:hypothetical protein
VDDAQWRLRMLEIQGVRDIRLLYLLLNNSSNSIVMSLQRYYRMSCSNQIKKLARDHKEVVTCS